MSQLPSASERAAGAVTNSRKRKDPPIKSNGPDGNKRNKTDQRAKQRDARSIMTQSSSKAFKNGELDVDKFVKAQEFEIRALEDGMRRSRKALNQRAFQQVPKDLRRRTASHNAKRVPKRLRDRAQREMREDNTPTVTARRRTPTRHMRLRMDTVKRLRALGRSKTVRADTKQASGEDAAKDDKSCESKETRTSQPAKVQSGRLAVPPVPKAKFRKRQIRKAWLPTHLFHAKRAHMTAPSKPLWRFSIPLSPTTKCYRPTHRAHNTRGAIAWDMSYMSTIGCTGRESSLAGILKGLGVGMMNGSEVADFWGGKGRKWRNGTRVRSSVAYEREPPHRIIAPISIVWCADNDSSVNDRHKAQRKYFVRVHPSAFFALWTEMVRLSKVAKPEVSIQDLRFQIGSIEISGPGSMEALQGILWPSVSDQTSATASALSKTWKCLSNATTAGMVPADSILAMEVQDPRLHHPPRTIKPATDVSERNVLETLAEWPLDSNFSVAGIFDSNARYAASVRLTSQKSINRRKASAAPGEYPAIRPTDPEIPVLLIASAPYTRDRERRERQDTWTVLLPWACVRPVWYSLMYYPLSSGGQPRFGGVDQTQQLSFESGRPWFPADYPATQAGWEWEQEQRNQRYAKWKARPKSKRLSWEKLDLGEGRRGEVGDGWSCHWECLLAPVQAQDAQTVSKDGLEQTSTSTLAFTAPLPTALTYLSAAAASSILGSATSAPSLESLSGTLVTIKLSLLTRGVPTACARIYRLPSIQANAKLRRAWIAMSPQQAGRAKGKGMNESLPRLPKDAPLHILQQRLAASLLEVPRVGEDAYPVCPPEEDLIGFVTTGNFNLSDGQGTGVGSIVLGKVLQECQAGGREARLCVVRCAGTSTGRLARWELTGS